MKNVPNTKYIYKNRGGFEIKKNINNQLKYFGFFETLPEALKIRNILINNNWNDTFKKRIRINRDIEDKYIFKMPNGKFCIYKTINNVSRYFGSYDTLTEARKVRDALECANFPYVQRSKKVYPKYICINTENTFSIHKRLNGKIECFGTFKSLDEAIYERDLLIKADWDYENLLNEI